MVHDLEIIKDICLLTQRKIVIWGALNSGRIVKRKLEESGIGKPYFFVDSDPKKWGINIEGYEVTSPDELRLAARNNKIAIIIASAYEEEIIQTIQELDLSDAVLCTRFGLDMAIHYHIDFGGIRDRYRKQHQFFYEAEKQIFKIEHERLQVLGWIRDTLRFPIGDKLICIFQPGKVGSSTVNNSLRKLGYYTIHRHNIIYNTEVFSSLYLEEYEHFMNALKHSSKVKIISLVREPISRDFSIFWHYINNGFFVYGEFLEKDFYTSFDKYLEYAYWNRNLLTTLPNYVWERGISWGDQFLWFENELRPVFDLSILNYNFDRSKGYTIIKKDNVELLLIKLEKLNMMEQVIGEFVGAENFRLLNDNEAKSFSYNQAYKEFKQNVKLKQRYIDYYYKNNPYMDYFYDRREQEEFLRRLKQV